MFRAAEWAVIVQEFWNMLQIRLDRRFLAVSGHIHLLQKMKLLTVAMLFLCYHIAVADEYRFELMVTTGMGQRVFNRNGAEKTIVFSKKSNKEASFLLTKILELEGINGTKRPEEWHGVPFDQAILLTGKLDPVVHRTPSAPNLAEAEDYQEFTLDTVMIRFPLVRHRAGKIFDTAFLETHFSFDTLFPDGLQFEGKKIDFTKHTAKREQDGADQPANTPRSKTEGDSKPEPESESRSR